MATPIQECDYNTNPTLLYQLLETKEWDGVEYQAEFFPKEVQTYVFRKDDRGVLRWRMLPLHAAIVKLAPRKTIEALLTAYPAAASLVDDQGKLPIHLAIKKHCEPETINVLLSANPKCVDVRSTFHDQTPYQMALESSSPHKEYYLRALQRGTPTFKTVTSSYSDLFGDLKLLPMMCTDTFFPSPLAA